GSSFGANFDVEGMYDRLKKIEVNKNSTPAWRLPNLGDSSKESITIASLDKLPFAVDAASTYEGADAREVIANNNIGYLLGNQNKVYNKDLNFGDLLVEGAQGNWTYSDGKTPANGKFPRWIYKTTATEIGGDYYNSGNGFAPLTQEEFDALPEGIQELVPAESGTVTGFNSIRLSQTYQNAAVQIYAGSDGNGQWTPHGQISWMGKTYGQGLTKTNYKGYAIDEDELQFTAEGYKIDENGFMFSADGYFVNTEWPLPGNVDEEGYLVDGDGNRTSDIDGDEIEYGGYELGSDADGFYLIKANGNTLTLDMGWGSTKRVTPKTGTPVALYNYTNGVALPNCGIWFKPAQSGKIRFVMYAETSGDGFALIKGHRTNATKENPFTVDYSKNGSDVTATEVGKYKIPKNVLFYFEFDVSEEDIEDGRYEYWLMQYGSGGAYFVYLDMGASAADDTSGIDREKAVSAVDFIYDGVELRQGDPSADAADAVIKVGDFIVHTSGGAEAFERYESSKTSVYFDDLKAVLNLVFLRLYSGSTDHADKTKTICLEKSDPVPDKNSEVHATFAAYVCPAISGGSGTVSGGNTGTVTPTPDPDPAPN
ncbi:MAG: hypothetical protein K2O81_04610, partial [Clostridia bacterium]|nr:hypothetical protein [Clostridia bacterium]